MSRSPSYRLTGIAVVGVASALIACARLPAPSLDKVAVAAVVLDLSTSTDASTRCDELRARVQSYLELPDTERFDVVVFGTSDESTDGQPVVLIPWKRYQPEHRLYGKRQHHEQRRDIWLNEMRSQCQTGLRLPERSPIYAGIATAVDSVAAHCTELQQHRLECGLRLLAIHADMAENSVPALTARLEEVQRLQGRGRKITKRPAALPRIDLSSFTGITVCGVANHLAQAQAGYSTATLHHVWEEVLGEKLPPFDGACPRTDAHPKTIAAKGGTP